MYRHSRCAGTPYEMGHAHGELLKEKTNSMMDAVWKYLEEQVVSDASRELSSPSGVHHSSDRWRPSTEL